MEIDIKKKSAEKTEKKQRPAHLFKKGQSGNPNGRPKGSGLCLTSLLKEYLEKKPEGQKEEYKHLFVKKLLKKALVDNDIKALKLIINYVDGLPKQAIDMTGEMKHTHTHSQNLDNYKKAQKIAKEFEEKLYNELKK